MGNNCSHNGTAEDDHSHISNRKVPKSICAKYYRHPLQDPLNLKEDA
jgi:hypothetical protein